MTKTHNNRSELTPSVMLNNTKGKSIKDILHSPGFMREVSMLLFVFAAVGGLFSLVSLVSLTMDHPDSEALASGVGLLVQSIVYVVLGIMIRRGSVKALWVAGVLFALDTLFAFFAASGKGFVVMIFWRGVLIYLLVRYVLRQRALSQDFSP